MIVENMTPTPHIAAKKDEIAKVVIMPGDPLRAKFIAENFLEKPQLVNTIRNMLIYTGTYKGKAITIAGSGMGMASIGIYSYELFKFYDVDCIIRVGSAGSYHQDIKLYDVINARECYSESTFAKYAANIDDNTIASCDNIFNLINETQKRLSHRSNLKAGLIHSSDVFYRVHKDE